MRLVQGVVFVLVAVIVASCATGADPAGDAQTSLSGQMLLEPGEMPVWNAAGSWEGIDDTDALRACRLPSAVDLGATTAISRSFEYRVELGEGETADPSAVPLLGINTVAGYPDDSAAEQGITGWLEALAACGAQQVGSVQEGTTWTVFAPDEASPGEGWFDFVGVAATGRTTTLVGFSVYGQDANYEGDPLAPSLEASLSRLP